jgi:hypothetical protein
MARGAEPASWASLLTAGSTTCLSCPPQALNIREQIGYPDYILEEKNKRLDEEYSSVRPALQFPKSSAHPLPPTQALDI